MIKKFDYDQIQKNIQELHQLKLSKSKLLIAVSGGVDSIVLLDHMLQLQKHLPEVVLNVLHYHHGLTGARTTDSYRKKAQSFVMEICKKQDLLCVTNTPEPTENRSEEHLRKARHSFFQENLQAMKGDVVVTAHHADDQFETQLMRLMRGTGPQGLQGMKILDAHKFRPLLSWTRSFIEEYARKKKLKWVEDPSNKSSDPLRNWMRNEWLPQLEAKRPGSLQAFRNSVLLVSQNLQNSEVPTWSEWISPQGIQRQAFLFLNKAEQRRVLAYYFKNLQLQNYKITHIDEILKRLDSSQKVLTFELLKCRWTIDTQHISAERLF